MLYKAKIPFVRNPNVNNVNNECEGCMQLEDQCSFFPPCGICYLFCGGRVYEGISSPIKHSHSHQSLQAVIHFVTFAFAFTQLESLLCYFYVLDFCCCHMRIHHSHCAQMES